MHVSFIDIPDDSSVEVKPVSVCIYIYIHICMCHSSTFLMTPPSRSSKCRYVFMYIRKHVSFIDVLDDFNAVSAYVFAHAYMQAYATFIRLSGRVRRFKTSFKYIHTCIHAYIQQAEWARRMLQKEQESAADRIIIHTHVHTYIHTYSKRNGRVRCFKRSRNQPLTESKRQMLTC